MRVLIPLPDHDFDVTEVAVPWRLLTEAGHEVASRPSAAAPRPPCDPRLLDGVIFGQLGRASPSRRRSTRELAATPEFRAPIAWARHRPDRVRRR